MIQRTHEPREFETTHWSLIESLRAGGDGASEALADLAWRYRGPVRAYIRRRTRCDATADDLTQGFFADVVLWRELFSTADSGKGKLRTLVLAALKRYLIDIERKAAIRPALSKTVDVETCDQFASRTGLNPGPGDAERDWTLSLVDEAHRRTREHFLKAGRGGHWSLFEARVVHPACHSVDPPPLEAIHAAHGFTSAAQAAAAVQTVKERFKALLAELMAQTGDAEEGSGSSCSRLRASLDGLEPPGPGGYGAQRS